MTRSILGRLACLGLATALLTGAGRSARASVRQTSQGARMPWDTFEGVCSQWASIWGVPEVLLWVVATIESNRSPGAVNDSGPDAARGGAWGLFQVTRDTAAELLAKTPALRQYEAARRWDGSGPSLLDPGLNAMLAAYYLGEFWRAYDGDFGAAVVAYKAPAIVARIMARGGDLAAELPPELRARLEKGLELRRQFAEAMT